MGERDRSPPATGQSVRRRADPQPRRLSPPRGIVIAGGGLKYFPSVWVNVNLIRRFECELPIQLWYMGDNVDVERAVWEDLGSGLEITGWVYAFTASPVRIQPAELVADDWTTPSPGAARYSVIFGEPTPLEPDDRLVAEDGAIYRLERLEQADRIDALPLATVVRE